MSEGLQIVISADVQDLQRNLKTAEKATQDFANNTKKAVVTAVPALNSLGQVARDLPFGFIAIQNNLPIVFDQFGALVTQSKGLGNAFINLGKALIGSAGLTFAIGGVIAIFTGLVQKYGSLSNAIGVITAKNKEAYISQLEYNKEINKNEAGIKVQIFTLNQYIKTLNDSNSSRDQQLAAFAAIKKIQPDIVAGIAQENALTSKNIDLINSRSTSYINFLQIQAKTNALSSVIETNEKKILDLQTKKADAQQKINDIEQERASIRKNIPAGNARDEKLLAAGLGVVSIQNSIKDYENEIQRLNDVNNNYYNNLTPLINQTATYNKTQLDGAAAAKQLTKDQSAAAAAAKKLADDYAAARKKMLDNRMDDAAFIPIINTDRINYEESVKKLKDLYNRINKDAFEEAAKTQGTVKGGIQVIPSQSVIDAINNKDKIVGIVKTLSSEIQQVLTQPFEEFFTDILTKGQLNFKTFADAIIKEIGRIIAKLVILKIVETIGNSLFPGAGTAAASTGNFIADAFGVKAPSIGSGGGLSGGLQLNGQVVFVQRGYDLVGVLNASNGSINNIG